MSRHNQALTGGFTRPVFDSQTVFHHVMNAMAQPGTIRPIMIDIKQPAPFGRAAAAIALTLCDADTPIWLQSGFFGKTVADWIAFHTGAPITSEKPDARFAFLSMQSSPCALSVFASGTQEYPDRSTTVIIEVPSIDTGQILTLDGPGIEGKRTIKVEGLPGAFFSFWNDNRTLYPRGIDLILTAKDSLLCLPRTTTIT